MSFLDDARVLSAAGCAPLAWRRSALALMGFGLVVARFGLCLRRVGNQPLSASQRGCSPRLGVRLLPIGVGVAVTTALRLRAVVSGLGTPPRCGSRRHLPSPTCLDTTEVLRC